MAENTFRLTTEEIMQLFDEQLPQILDEHPELEPRIYRAFLKAFVHKEEFALLQKEVSDFRAETQANFERVDKRFSDFRTETQANFERIDNHLDGIDNRLDGIDNRLDGIDARFEQVDARFEQVDARFDRVEGRLDALHRTITSLGGRWGIYNEDVIRQMIASLLEESYGAIVERKIIDGEEFDVVISDGDHILIEITSRAKSDVQRRLERKRDLYIAKTGQTPTRIILAVGSIYSTRAQALREAGFEVVEPSEDLEEWS